MPVAENKIIVVFFLQYFFTVYDQPLFVFPEKDFVALPGLRPALAAEIIGDAHADGGRQDAEEPVAGFVAEYLLDEFIPMVSGSEAIAMPYKEFLSVKGKRSRLEINGNIEFLLEIIFHPHIVIAHEEI